MELLEAVDQAAALEMLHEMGCTDGLPVIIPTTELVDRMVLASGLDGDVVLGEVGPLGGVATVEKLATNAVMAGCSPDYMPFVLAAMQAVLQPEFDLSEVQSTTHSIAPLLVVNGPLGAITDIASGFGALGPGHRANACIGRALRLAMMNIGGAKPGVSDMALLGHPGKFSMCLAEAEHASPFPPMSEMWGYPAGSDVVTVLGTEAPHSVMFVNDADDPDSPDRLLRILAEVSTNAGSNNLYLRTGSVAIALNPEHANVLAKAGWTRSSIQDRLFELCHVRRSRIRSLNAALTPKGSDDDLIPVFESPDRFLVFVAGADGLYSVVFPSWSAGAHGNNPVHMAVVSDQACEVPFATS